MSKHYRKENNCLNCGKDVDGKFCSNCGQENIETKEKFWSFVSHGLAHYFHYDSKFQTTIKPFLTKPGQLTVDYFEGRRASQIPPLSLYLFITLIYFILAPVFNKNQVDYSDYSTPVDLSELENKNPKATDQYYLQFGKLTIEQQALDIAKLDSTAKIKRSQDKSDYNLQDKVSKLKRLHIQRLDSTVNSYRTRQASLKESQRDDLIERLWEERKIKYGEKTGVRFNKKQFMDKYFPKLLFILMPLFAFFLMLNFRRNKKLYMEHLIYTVHLFSFAYFNYFIFEFLAYALPAAVKPYIDVIQSIIFIWYIYRSIRVVYQRKRWATVGKLFSMAMLFGAAFMIVYVLAISVALSMA